MIKVIRIFCIVVKDGYFVVKGNHFFNEQVNQFSWLFLQSFADILYYIVLYHHWVLGQSAFLVLF